MPRIGSVEYDDEGFEHMRQLHALWEAESDPERKAALLAEAETTHEFYKQFPGIRMHTPEGDPDEVRPAEPRAGSQLELNDPSGSPTSPSGRAHPARFYGTDPTATERASGEAIADEDTGPLKPGGAGHLVLSVYRDGRQRTAYAASMEASGDYHSKRRESTRLLTRGFLLKTGTLANPAPAGREHVDAYRITDLGLAELRRLDAS